MGLIKIGTYPEFMVRFPGVASFKTKRMHPSNLVVQQGGFQLITGTTDCYRVIPAGSETGTAGPLSFVFFNAGGAIVGVSDWLVVDYMPGELSPAERNAVADALLHRVDGIEPGITLQSALKISNAMNAGLVNGGSLSWQFRDLADTLDRITMDLDGLGKRLSVTLDLG